MINRVVLTGRLTRNPELKKTQSGLSVVSFTLAVDRNFKNSSGNTQADFIQCVAWRKTAEVIANGTSKGSLVGIDGSIQTRNYDGKNGQRVFVTEVLVDNFSFLERKGVQTQNTNYGHQVSQNNQATKDPFSSNDQLDISDDDLPF